MIMVGMGNGLALCFNKFEMYFTTLNVHDPSYVKVACVCFATV